MAEVSPPFVITAVTEKHPFMEAECISGARGVARNVGVEQSEGVDFGTGMYDRRR